MECRNCPYGKEDFERRMACYKKTVEEQGIPNDIYGYLEPEEAPDDFEQFVWCEKVGGKVYCFGRCEDAYVETQETENRSKQKRRNKRERDQKHREHLKDLFKNSQGCPSPAYPVDKHGNYVNYTDNPEWLVWFPEDAQQEVAYYKRQYRGKRSKYLKKQSNRKIRRYDGELKGKGYQCHRIFDFWYELD